MNRKRAWSGRPDYEAAARRRRLEAQREMALTINRDPELDAVTFAFCMGLAHWHRQGLRHECPFSAGKLADAWMRGHAAGPRPIESFVPLTHAVRTHPDD